MATSVTFFCCIKEYIRCCAVMASDTEDSEVAELTADCLGSDMAEIQTAKKKRPRVRYKTFHGTEVSSLKIGVTVNVFLRSPP